MADRAPEDIAPAPMQEAALRMTFTPELVQKMLWPIELPPAEVFNLAASLSVLADEWLRGPIRERDPNSEARGKRLAEALTVLAEELPAFIEDNRRSANRILFGAPRGEPNGLERLLYAVQFCAAPMREYSVHGGKEWWHTFAKLAAYHFDASMRAAGIRAQRKQRNDFAKAALHHIGLAVTPEAIRKALR